MIETTVREQETINDIYELESKDDLTIVAGLGGAKGSGKSLMLAWQALYDMCVLGRTVWSNMKIHTGKLFLEQGYPYKETKELDIDLVYMLDEGLAEGTIILDEIQNLSDSRSSMTMKNRLLNGMLYQVRKRQLRIFYSIKDRAWRDKRLAYETDVWCDCVNMAKTPDGRERGLKGGQVIALDLWDESGVVTGRSANQYSEPYKSFWFKAGRRVYDCYNSWETVDLETIYTNVKMDLKQRVITNKTQGPENSEIDVVVADVVDYLHGQSVKEIGRDSFRELVYSKGLETDKRSIGSAVKRYGLKTRQKSDGSRVYVLPERA